MGNKLRKDRGDKYLKHTLQAGMVTLVTLKIPVKSTCYNFKLTGTRRLESTLI